MNTIAMLRLFVCLALGTMLGCTQILGIEPLKDRDGGGTSEQDGGGTIDAAPPGGCVEGTTCKTGSDCELGKTACVQGQPVCVASGIAPADTVCRPARGPCDVVELCDGETTACPGDVLVATGADCRVDGEQGSCTGVSPDCVAGCVAGAPCDTGNACERGEIECSTGQPLCVAVGLKGEGTICRDVAGDCDAPEVCDGVSATCPDDGFLPATEGCRESQGLCDPAETCTGDSAACPVNALLAAGESCRAADGLCDKEDVCDGASPECPDAVQPAASECRRTTKLCDVVDTCDGVSKDCPDEVRQAGHPCRNADPTKPCDAADTCDGVSPDCTDQVKAKDVLCGAAEPGKDCDRVDLCDGTSKNCADRVEPAGTVCRADRGECDFAETCNGSSKNCPADVTEPNGVACGNPGGCAVERCISGVCQIVDELCNPGCAVCLNDECVSFCDGQCPCP